MFRTRGVFCALTMLATLGCRDINFTQEGYKQAVLSGLSKIPEARQFDELFGKENVDHFISYHGSRDVGNEWNSEAFIDGRYVLTMQVPVKVGRSFDEVIDVLGEPKFYLVEVQRVYTASNGQVGTRFYENRDIPYPFTRTEWGKIYKAEGDLSALGVSIKKRKPVQDFDRFVQGQRRPRIQVER